MAAVAARETVVKKSESSQRKSGKHVKRQRGVRMRGALRMLGYAFGLAFVFGYVGVYGTLATTAYSRSRISSECRQDRIRNQRLKVEYIRLSSPGKVMAAAQKTGMVYADRYDYLNKSQTVASASK